MKVLILAVVVGGLDVALQAGLAAPAALALAILGLLVWLGSAPLPE